MELWQAEKGKAVLNALVAAYGGKIYSTPRKSQQHQRCFAWRLSGQAATDFCKLMHQYAFLKKPQLLLAGQCPPKTKHVRVECTHVASGTTAIYDSLNQAVTTLAAEGAVLRQTDISGCLNGRARTTKGYSWRRLQRDFEKVDRQEVVDQLKRMKKEPHDKIEVPLPIPYAAGFFDGDGCVSLGPSGGHRHTVSQKHRSICDAFQRRFGGKIHCTNKDHYIWTMCQGGRDFILAIQPHLIGKQAQADLVLTYNGKGFQDIRSGLAQMKGNHCRRPYQEQVLGPDMISADPPAGQHRGNSPPTISASIN